jgi:hypothetical protein
VPEAQICLLRLAEMPASTVRSLMLVLLGWLRHDSQLARGESVSASHAIFEDYH